MKTIKLTFIFLVISFFISCGDDDDTNELNIDMTLINAEINASGFDLNNQDFVGDLWVSCTIQNIGSDTFNSGDNQQSVQLLVDGQIRQVTSFNNIPGGASRNIEPFQLISIYEYGSEFNPEIKYVINYDPDIGLDDNRENDDNNLNNNEITISNSIIIEAIEN